MQALKNVSSDIIANLHQCGHISGDVISIVDVKLATWQSIRSIKMFNSYITCLCLSGALSDFGDDWIMLNEATQ